MARNGLRLMKTRLAAPTIERLGYGEEDDDDVHTGAC